MEDNSEKVVNMARILAIVHIIVGILLFCLGVADRVVEYFWTGYGYFGIWTGVWMCITGGVGIPGTRKEQTKARNTYAGVFMGFSITSAVFGVAIIVCYSMSIERYRNKERNNYDYGEYYYKYESRYIQSMALSVFILILGIAELAIGIWVSVCLCMMNLCCTPPQQVQVNYTADTGYFMTQGGPVAIPIQTDGGIAAAQTAPLGAQGGQPQMVGVSGTENYKPHLVQIAPSSWSHCDRLSTSAG